MHGIEAEISKLEADLANKTSELKALKDKRERLKAGDDREIADLLHTTLCRWNHTDGCGYHYEKWGERNAGTKGEWLKKARKVKEFAVENNVGLELVINIIIETNKGL